MSAEFRKDIASDRYDIATDISIQKVRSKVVTLVDNRISHKDSAARSRSPLMNQETLNGNQTQPKTQDFSPVNSQTQTDITHDDNCCGGKCELAWKPVRVSSN